MAPDLKDLYSYDRESRPSSRRRSMKITCEDGGREEERSGEMKSSRESRMRKRTGNKGCTDSDSL